MRFAQLRRHGDFVVEVGKAGVGVQGAGVENGLCGLFDFGLLRVGGRRPREVVLDYSVRVLVTHFQSASNGTHPRIMNIGGKNA